MLPSEYCAKLGVAFDCGASGPQSAQIAIVSDYPGETERITKVPFAGKSGKFLWEALAKIGLRRQDVYCTNAVKRVVDENEYINAQELSLYKEVLHYELAALPNLKYILALGRYALQALGPSSGLITDWRGSVLSSEGRLILFTHNPAYILRQDPRTQELVEPLAEVIFGMDIAKFAKLLAGRYVPPQLEARIVETIDDFRQTLAELYRRAESNPVALDIEHMGAYTGCVGFCAGDNIGYVIPFCTHNANIFTLEEELEVRESIRKFLLNNTTRIVGQFVNSDLCWLWYKDWIGPCPPVYGDTMLAHHLLYPTLPHNLAFLVSQYTWHPYYKHERTDWLKDKDIDQFWQYNAKDTVLTYNIHEILVNSLQSAGLYDLYRNHVMRLTRHLCDATVTGISIDTELKATLERELAEEYQVRKKALEEKIQLGTTSFASPKQLGKLLYETLQVPLLSRKTRSGAYPTDKYTLLKIIDSARSTKQQRELCKGVLELRAQAKFLSTYVKVPLDPDNKFRAAYNQAGVQSAPGRLSSMRNQWGTASNIQNQPERSRAMFIAPEGFCFVYIDGAQAEARYVAWDADIPQWKDDFEKARHNPGVYDCHRALASQMFNVPYDQVPAKDYDAEGNFTIRYLGKRARHGLNYRMMPVTFAERTGIPLVQAQNIYEIYHKLTPQLKQWWHRLEKEVIATKRKLGYGLLTNSFGRRLVILERLTTSALEAIVAFRPQSSIGDHLQRVWYSCHEDDNWPLHAKILINVHDSLTAIVPIDKAEQAARIMVKHAETPIMVNGEPLIVPAEAKVSVPDDKGKHRWNQLKAMLFT